MYLCIYIGIANITNQAGDFIDIPRRVYIDTNSSNYTVSQVACGGNHNIAIVTASNTNTVTSNTSNTDVYTWGYGDMLALGHGKEQDEFIPKVLYGY